jgi:putative GTP pyrophosphokinase
LSKHKSIEVLRSEYLSIEPSARRFCDELTRQLQILVDQQKVQLGFPISARVKTWESISEKLNRLPLNLHSITDLQDLIGLRLIFLFKRDADNFCNLMRNTFTIIKQEDTRSRLKEDQFGYASFHFVVKVPEQWLVVPAFSSFGDLKAEIQIRTVAQHLWADASHVLQYKNELNIPAPIRRSINRVSALLETVDLEFERVLNEKDIYRQTLNPREIDQTLNTDSLELLLDSMLPAKNKDEVEGENYEELLSDLRRFGVSTTEELIKIINENKEAILEEDANEVRQQIHDNIAPFSEDPERILKKGVFYTHVGLVRCALQRQFPIEWEAYDTEKEQQLYSEIFQP